MSIAEPPPLPRIAEAHRTSIIAKLIHSRESGVFIAFVILFAALSILRNRTFLSAENLSNLGSTISYFAILGIGVLFVIVTGGVDLSLGSAAGLCGYIGAMAIVATPNPTAGIFVGLLVGILIGVTIGAINGSIVAFVRVTPFIVTLGMLGIGRGMIYIIAKYYVAPHATPPRDSPIAVLNIPQLFINVGQGKLFGIPVPVLVLVVVALIAHLVLTYTVFGRRLYAIGGNEEATHLSGINVDWIKFFAYVVCSAICAITGMLYVARYSQGSLVAGNGDELNAIAAAVIGGTSLMGGAGSVLGVILGACIMGIVANGLDLLEIPSEPKLAIIGAVIIVAAIVDVVRNRRRA